MITGTYTMTLSTPDQVLSTTANAGSEKDFQLTVSNTGSAPVTNVAMSATAPTSWKVDFDPATIPSIDAGQTTNVTAHITPTSDAIAGDYEMTITGKAHRGQRRRVDPGSRRDAAVLVDRRGGPDRGRVRGPVLGLPEVRSAVAT